MIYFLLLIISFVFIISAVLIYKFSSFQFKITNVWIPIATFIVLFSNVFWLGCYHFTGVGINWSVIYTLTSSLIGAGVRSLIFPALATCVVFIIVLWAEIKFLSSKITKKRCQKRFTLLSLVFSFLAIIFSPVWLQYNATMMPIKGDSGKDFYKYYIPPVSKIEHPEYNLVYIYAESLERSYFDNKHFPDLTPSLGAIMRSGLDFSGTEQYAGMDFTIGGIVASQCGLPLFVPSGFGGNTDVTSDFFSGKLCLGDILKNSGYENYFFQGADLRFANKNQFFRTHSIEHAFGLAESIYKDDLSYQNEWGLFDNIVLQQAWDKFKELSSAGKRFSIFTLTLDTHPPQGYLPEECKNNTYNIEGKDVAALSAVLCSQREIAQFIGKIKNSPWGNNTIVVVSSDHLAMQNTATAIDYLNKYSRKNLFFVLKEGIPASIKSQPRNTMDNGATVLELLGGGNNLGLGRSSLSRKSLTARFPDFGRKIISWSPHIKKLWGTPDHINTYEVNTVDKSFIANGKVYPLPLLIGVTSKYVSFITDRRGQAPLRFKLANSKPDDYFIWIDRCFQIGNIWAQDQNDIVLSTDWCKAEGRLSGKVDITKIPLKKWKNTFEPMASGAEKLAGNKLVVLQNKLRIMNDRIRYPGERILFYLEGMPKGVKSITGMGKPENWGRWSDAMLEPKITITFENSLPSEFYLEVVAKAYDKNINQPVSISIGGQTSSIYPLEKSKMFRVYFSRVKGNTIEITPPYPQLSREGNYIAAPTDAPMRKIGVGLVSLHIKPVASDSKNEIEK